MNDLTGEVAKLRARMDAMSGAPEEDPEVPEEDPEAGGGEDMPEDGEDKDKGKDTPAASASSNMDARVARLERQLRVERRRTALASLPEDNAAGYTAADAEELAEMPDTEFSKLIDRLKGSSSGAAASGGSKPEGGSKPAPGSVFSRKQAPAASSANGGTPSAGSRASGDDEERLRDEAWAAAEARASTLRGEGKAPSVMELYAEEKRARGVA